MDYLAGYPAKLLAGYPAAGYPNEYPIQPNKDIVNTNRVNNFVNHDIVKLARLL